MASLPQRMGSSNQFGTPLICFLAFQLKVFVNFDNDPDVMSSILSGTGFAKFIEVCLRILPCDHLDSFRGHD